MLQLLWRLNVHLSPLQFAMLAIPLAALAAQVATLYIFIKRKLHTEFPIFFRYTIFCVACWIPMGAEYLFSCECLDNRYLFWICSGLLVCFQFGVLYESFVNALKPYAALIDLGKMLFRWAAVFLLLAALLTALAARGPEEGRVLYAQHVVERILALMQIGLLLLFFGFERRLGLAWRSYSMAVALGLGISAAATLSTSYVEARYPSWQNGVVLVTKVLYLGIVAFWALCFRHTEPARKNVMDSPSRLIFQRWNEALLAHGYGQSTSAAGVETFLPGIEKTVERVMARTIH
jgi:hypothetical protein